MLTSQNGMPANDRSLIVSYAIPGGKVALRRGPVGELLAEFARRWHAEVEPLTWPGNWGYAERLIRGSTTDLSNHASGSAIDLNAPRHPLGTDPARSLNPGQLATIRRMISDSAGCLRWGGDYTGRRDPMHVEAMKGDEECAEVLARWRHATAPRPAPPPGSVLATLQRGMMGDDRVRRLQQFLNRYQWNPALPVLPVTGNYLDQTVTVVKAAQAQCGVTGPDADGTIVGPRTSSAFAARGAGW